MIKRILSVLTILLATSDAAFAGQTPPPGTNGQLMYNNNGLWGAEGGESAKITTTASTAAIAGPTTLGSLFNGMEVHAGWFFTCDGTEVIASDGTTTFTPGTDQSVIVQALESLVEVAGGQLILPPGVCTFKNISVGSKVTIKGQGIGYGGTVIVPPTAYTGNIFHSYNYDNVVGHKTTAYACDGLGDVPYGLGFEQFSIHGNWAGSGQPLIEIYASGNTIKDVYLEYGNTGTYNIELTGPSTHDNAGKSWFNCKEPRQEETRIDNLTCMGGGAGCIEVDAYDTIIGKLVTGFSAGYGLHLTTTGSIANIDHWHTYAQTPSPHGGLIEGSAQITNLDVDGTQVVLASGGSTIHMLNTIGGCKQFSSVSYPALSITGGNNSVLAGHGTIWHNATNCGIVTNTGSNNEINYEQAYAIAGGTDTHTGVSAITSTGTNNKLSGNCTGLAATSDACVVVQASSVANNVSVVASANTNAIAYDNTTSSYNVFTGNIQTTGGETVMTGTLGATDSANIVTNNATITSFTQIPDGSVTSPAVQFSSSHNTGIYYGGSNNILWAANGTKNMYLDSSQLQIQPSGSNVGYSTRISSAGSDYFGKVQIAETSDFVTGAGAYQFTNDNQPARIICDKSRGTSTNSFTVLQSGDGVCRIMFGGSDGTRFREGAAITADTTAVSSATAAPMGLSFRAHDASDVDTLVFSYNAAGVNAAKSIGIGAAAAAGYSVDATAALGPTRAPFYTQLPGANIASASTIAPLTGITHITGTSAIDTITVPTGFYSGAGGCLTLWADAAWTTTTGGNILNAITAVANTPYFTCYDPTSTKWYLK